MFCTLDMCKAGTAPGDDVKGVKGGGKREGNLVLTTGESAGETIATEASDSVASRSSGARDTTFDMANGKLYGSSSA